MNKSSFSREVTMPSKSLTLGILGFVMFAYPGIYFAITGNIHAARILIELAMIPGYAGVICEVAAYVKKWQAMRNMPRCLG